MLRKLLLAVLFLIVVIGGLAAVKTLQVRAMMAAGANFAMPPETVSSAVAERVQWDTSLSAIGTVSPVQGVLLRSELAGLVQRIAFESGGHAEAGQVVLELDRSTEQALLRAAEARAELARSNLRRAQDLFAKEVLPQADLDTAEALVSQTAADVDQQRVAVAKKVIRAPFSGRFGIREVQLGQYLDVGSPIVALQSIDPVHVDFSLPEQAVSRLASGMTVRVQSDAVPGRTFEGSLTAVSPEVDAATRNIRLQATLSGTDGTLLPGMFARVDLMLPEVMSPIVIPVTAVLSAPYGDAVFVIEDVANEAGGGATKRVRMTTVRLGETRGDVVAVEQGLLPGQVVASSGVFKLSNDTAVVVNDSLAPQAETNPRPKDS